MSCLFFERDHPIGQFCAESAPVVGMIYMSPLISRTYIISETMRFGLMGEREEMKRSWLAILGRLRALVLPHSLSEHYILSFLSLEIFFQVVRLEQMPETLATSKR